MTLEEVFAILDLFPDTKLYQVAHIDGGFHLVNSCYHNHFRPACWTKDKPPVTYIYVSLFLVPMEAIDCGECRKIEEAKLGNL